MSYLYFTMVKASSGFWENLLLKQIEKDLSFEFLYNKTDEIIITTESSNALDKIVMLSKEYPAEAFQVKIAGEDIYENYVYLYECSNGDLKLIKEGYEYCFCINVSDRDRLDKSVFETFKKKVAAYYKRIGKMPPNVHLDLSSDDAHFEESDANLSVTIEYKIPGVCLTAKKSGTTYVEVGVDFFDTKEKSLKPKRPQQNYYDELPF